MRTGASSAISAVGDPTCSVESSMLMLLDFLLLQSVLPDRHIWSHAVLAVVHKHNPAHSLALFKRSPIRMNLHSIRVH